MSEERSIEDKLAGIIVVTLGGAPVEIKVKPISDAQKYGRLVGRIIGKAVGAMASKGGGVATDSTIVFEDVFAVLAGDGVSLLPELLYAYAPEVQSIAATQDEILDAAMEVVSATFPLYLRMATTIWKMATRAGVTLGAASRPA